MSGASVKFNGAVNKITTDAEGWSKVVFEIPKSDIIAAIKLVALTEKELEIEVRERREENGREENGREEIEG